MQQSAHIKQKSQHRTNEITSYTEKQSADLMCFFFLLIVSFSPYVLLFLLRVIDHRDGKREVKTGGKNKPDRERDSDVCREIVSGGEHQTDSGGG